jgi:glycerophosphoryl diester phosphodiesterase
MAPASASTSGREPGGATAIWAHRGARTVAPENTIEAFSRALALGADGVELDVHGTDDGGLIVHHDAVAPDLGVLARLPLAEIRARRPDIPTLEEVLDCCAGSLVNIEIKNSPGDDDFDEAEHVAEAVVALLDARRRADRVLDSSFHLPPIDRVHDLDASVPTGFLVFGDDHVGALARCTAGRHGALHPNAWFLGEPALGDLLARTRAVGVAVNVWTVNEEAEIARLAAAGVDAVITDVPDVARRLLS